MNTPVMNPTVTRILKVLLAVVVLVVAIMLSKEILLHPHISEAESTRQRILTGSGLDIARVFWFPNSATWIQPIVVKQLGAWDAIINSLYVFLSSLSVVFILIAVVVGEIFQSIVVLVNGGGMDVLGEHILKIVLVVVGIPFAVLGTALEFLLMGPATAAYHVLMLVFGLPSLIFGFAGTGLIFGSFRQPDMIIEVFWH